MKQIVGIAVLLGVFDGDVGFMTAEDSGTVDDDKRRIPGLGELRSLQDAEARLVTAQDQNGVSFLRSIIFDQSAAKGSEDGCRKQPESRRENKQRN